MTTSRISWDKRLVNTADPSLLTLSPPGTFIYRIIPAGFDGNSNFQACYTHRTAGGVDLSAWAADNDGTILTEVVSIRTLDVLTDGSAIVQTTYSSDPGQQIKITDYDGYFIFEATDGIPPSSTTDFDTVSTSTATFGLTFPHELTTGISFDTTNFPFPVPLDLAITTGDLLLVETILTFDTILNSNTGSGNTTGRPDDGMLYPRGFQTIGTGGLPTPDPDPTPDPTPDELPPGPQYFFIASNLNTDLYTGAAQTFVLADERYLNYFLTSDNGTTPPTGDGNIKSWYIYYIDDNTTLQTLVLPVIGSINTDTFTQIYWPTSGPAPETIIGTNINFVISDTNLFPA